LPLLLLLLLGLLVLLRLLAVGMAWRLRSRQVLLVGVECQGAL
jgi:hypothetical protein